MAGTDSLGFFLGINTNMPSDVYFLIAWKTTEIYFLKFNENNIHIAYAFQTLASQKIAGLRFILCSWD